MDAKLLSMRSLWNSYYMNADLRRNTVSIVPRATLQNYGIRNLLGIFLKYIH